MVDLIDVLENELKRQNVSNPRELARKQAVALSCFLGGRQFYIPCGDTDPDRVTRRFALLPV
ncbi:hypothetical protein OH693_14525 [Escherichia coli]|nr:hypothetical protein [Escherichia coli]